MNKYFIILLAFKNLRGHKLRTVLTVGGVSIGIAFIVFLVSLGTGLQKISTNQIANLEALSIMDVTVGKSKIVTINDGTVDKFERLGDIKEVSPSTSLPVKMEYKSSALDGVLYAKNLDYISLEELRPQAGKLYTSDDQKEVLLNTAVLNQLNVKSENIIGEEIDLTLSINQDLTGGDEALRKEDTFKVTGVIDNDSAPYVYIPLDVLRTYEVINYTNLKVKTEDRSKVDTVKQKIENMGYKVKAIKSTVDQINQFFSLFQLILLSFGSVAIIIASIGMFNTLTISLLEKTREIGFMKALGATRKDVYRIFIFESLLIGFIGGAVGLLGGISVGASLNNSIISLAESTGNKAVAIFYFDPLFMSLIFLFAVFISLLTGLYPSFRASRIKALDAIRYE